MGQYDGNAEKAPSTYSTKQHGKTFTGTYFMKGCSNGQKYTVHKKYNHGTTEGTLQKVIFTGGVPNRPVLYPKYYQPPYLQCKGVDCVKYVRNIEILV
jgi:hypothetical protein